MYRRSDPRWNRTLQHITENLEHANDTAQENIYGFTQRYIDPCFASVTQCVAACTAPCLPAAHDRRRHRGRSRGRAESSFDFYDDWDDADEGDGLLGWGSDNLERFLGASAGYGATAQPGRQRAMSYGQRNRDARYNTPRRSSATLPRDAAQDPTLIPSSSYFGFLGRLPFRMGARGLRYKPSAADLTEHPGAARRSLEHHHEHHQPLMDGDGDHEAHAPENKGHRRQRSDTRTSGHTTDSLSSRGDIFPSEDELEDAVPLDDEFTISLERRSTGQYNDDSASSRPRSTKSKRPGGSRTSTRTTPDELHQEEHPAGEEHQGGEDGLRLLQEKNVDRKTKDPAQMSTLQSTVSPLIRSPSATSEHNAPRHDAVPLPARVHAQPMPGTTSFPVDASDHGQSGPSNTVGDDFVPARLPQFGSL